LVDLSLFPGGGASEASISNSGQVSGNSGTLEEGSVGSLEEGELSEERLVLEVFLLGLFVSNSDNFDLDLGEGGSNNG
jgi:hypothetical protein